MKKILVTGASGYLGAKLCSFLVNSDFQVSGLIRSIPENSDEWINSIPEKDVDRTSDEGKASSVQFVHFNFSGEQIKKFKHPDTQVSISIDHSLYRHSTKISKNIKNALIEDFI